MLTKEIAFGIIKEISPFLMEEGLRRGEILLSVNSKDGYTVQDLYQDYGSEFSLRFLLIDSTLDTQQVSKLRAESIHKIMLNLRDDVYRCCAGLSTRVDLTVVLANFLKAEPSRVLTQVNHAMDFIEKVGLLKSWFNEKKPREAYRDIMHADAFGSYDKCARLYLKFIGHPHLGLGVIKRWNAHLNEFPIIVDGAIARFFLTTGLIQPFIIDFLGSEEIMAEYMDKIATFQGYDAKYVCAVALEDPINFLVSKEKCISDTLAFENGIWRFSRKGGICLDNPIRRGCMACPINEILKKYDLKCSMKYRAYGGPLFSQICQNYIEYQKDVVHVCSERTEMCFQETFEKLFKRPLSPSLLKTRFIKSRGTKRFVHLLPRQ